VRAQTPFPQCITDSPIKGIPREPVHLPFLPKPLPQAPPRPRIGKTDAAHPGHPVTPNPPSSNFPPAICSTCFRPRGRSHAHRVHDSPEHCGAQGMGARSAHIGLGRRVARGQERLCQLAGAPIGAPKFQSRPSALHAWLAIVVFVGLVWRRLPTAASPVRTSTTARATATHATAQDSTRGSERDQLGTHGCNTANHMNTNSPSTHEPQETRSTTCSTAAWNTQTSR